MKKIKTFFSRRTVNQRCRRVSLCRRLVQDVSKPTSFFVTFKLRVRQKTWEKSTQLVYDKKRCFAVSDQLKALQDIAGVEPSTARRSSKVTSQKSKVLYIKAFTCLKWLLYLRRTVLVLLRYVQRNPRVSGLELSVSVRIPNDLLRAIAQALSNNLYDAIIQQTEKGDDAWVLLSLLAGGVTLARAVWEETLAEQISAAVRTGAMAFLEYRLSYSNNQ